MLFYSYRPGSQGCRALAMALGSRRIRHQNSRFVGRASKTVANWGATELPSEALKCKVINHPDKTRVATDKLAFLTVLDATGEVNIPEFTTDINEAKGWAREGATVVCRTLTKASAGRGIVLAAAEGEVVPAPLYTKYKPKRDEYRVHVINGEVVDVQRKMRSRDVPDDEVDWKIRTHDSGFVFGREGVEAPECVTRNAEAAIEILDLDFGAVDVIYNEKEERAYVLEVNTAPGLTGTTLEKYTQAFRENYNAA